MKPMKSATYEKGKAPFTTAEMALLADEITVMEAQIALVHRYDDLRVRIHDVRGRFRMLFEKHGRQCPDDIWARSFPSIVMACYAQDALHALAASDVKKAKAVLQEALSHFESDVVPTLPPRP